MGSLHEASEDHLIDRSRKMMIPVKRLRLDGGQPLAVTARGRRTAFEAVRSGISRAAFIAVIGAAAAAAGVAVARGAETGGDAAALRASQAAIGSTVSDHVLTDESGRRFHLAEFRGRPLLLTLVYTTCYGICSGLTVHLRDVVKVAREAVGQGSFSVLTVGFDTERDSPESMHEFRRERGIEDPRWRFASADAATVRRLADEVGFTWTVLPEGLDHIAQVTVVDAAGRVTEQVYGQDFPPTAVVEPLRRLVQGRPAERASARGILEQVKLLCTVYDPASGRYRFDFSMIVGLLPSALVLGILAIGILVVSRGKGR